MNVYLFIYIFLLTIKERLSKLDIFVVRQSGCTLFECDSIYAAASSGDALLNKLSISLVDALFFIVFFFSDKHLKLIKMLFTFHFL